MILVPTTKGRWSGIASFPIVTPLPGLEQTTVEAAAGGGSAISEPH